MIETERFILRKFKPEDAPILAKICNDYDIAKFTLRIPYPYAESDAEFWIAKTINNVELGKSYELAVVDKKNPLNVLGCVSLVGINNISKRAEIGYWVAKSCWNTGIATEAAKAIIEFGFKTLKLHSLFARHFSKNLASGRVMQKCGMRYIGKMLESECRFDEFHDVDYYEILNKDL